MAATGTLSHQKSACNSPEQSRSIPTTSKLVPRYGVITLSGYGISVRVDRGHLVLEDGISDERRQARLPRVGHALKRLVVIGADGQVTLAALRWLADQNASFVMLERDGSVLATTGPVRSSDARLRRAQALAVHSGKDLVITRELIIQKLAAQERVARGKLSNTAAAEEIAQYRSEVPDAGSIPSIRLLEARAASAYWSAWRDVEISFPRNDLPRIPDHWGRFGARISPISGSPRLAANPANAILNYLYAVLESEARLAAAAVGLDPGMGVLHVDQQYRDSLACDLMEPVRPIVDEYVLDWLSRGPLKREWFFEQRDGNCRLTDQLITQLSCSSSTWARAVAPYAEWTAQVLWQTTKKAPSENTQVTTPLTGRRKSEGRGNSFVPVINKTPQPQKLCRICGGPVKRSNHCPACARITASERMIEVARIGREVVRGPRAFKSQKHTKRTKQIQSGHAVAITWWDPQTLPSWLNEECYRQKIQPKLKELFIRELAGSIGVSKAYAAQIRLGKATPHPRHWKKLADLAGVG
jgi:CRISPR-associated endonuclease Cas1